MTSFLPCVCALTVLWTVLTAYPSLPSQIQDCCCDTETVSAKNQEFLNEILTVIRKRTFFRIFKVDIYKSCKLWPDNTLCFKPTCSVEQCCEEDIPRKWIEQDTVLNVPLDLFLSDAFDHWNNVDENQWVSAPDTEDQMVYIDLERNPDGYTGYKGEEAGKIWRAIYEAKNLLYRNIEESQRSLFEMEDRVLFRLISGFHTLTTAMVFAYWPLPDDPGQFGPNLELYEKVLHGHTDWIENLYFDFVFLLRAINKASDVLREYDYHTGNPSDDAMTMGLINYLLQTDFIREQCDHQNSFDESIMFQEERFEIIDNFRNVFRNISEIIDCVGCEKCKLHAKCELLGLGTALKILFSRDVLSVDMFERNEILALMVTVGKYSDAIQFVENMEEQIELNRIKANIQGYVEIDNQQKAEEKKEAAAAAESGYDFDELMGDSMRDLFESNTKDACRKWNRYCSDHQEQSEHDHAKHICDLFREHCLL